METTAILIFATVMSTITTATLYKIDDMLTFHTYLRTPR